MHLRGILVSTAAHEFFVDAHLALPHVLIMWFEVRISCWQGEALVLPVTDSTLEVEC